MIDDDFCLTAIQCALDVVAEEPISTRSVMDELYCFSMEVSEQTGWDDTTNGAFLENPLLWKNVKVSYTRSYDETTMSSPMSPRQQSESEGEDLVAAEGPQAQVFDPSDWDDDEICETSSAVDEREVLVPGTTRHRQAEWTAFVEARAHILRPTTPNTVGLCTHRSIERPVQQRPPRARTDSLSSQSTLTSATTQSSASLQTARTASTTSGSPQAALRRAVWNNVARKMEPRLYEWSQAPVPMYTGPTATAPGWEVYWAS